MRSKRQSQNENFLPTEIFEPMLGTALTLDEKKTLPDLPRVRSYILYTAMNYLQYRRHSPNREILQIGRQFCL